MANTIKGGSVKPSLWTSFFYELKPEDAVKAISAAGFRNCEMSYEHMNMLVGRPEPEKQLEKMRRVAESLKMNIGQLHSSILSHFISPKLPIEQRISDLVCSDPKLRKNEMKLVEEWLGYCRILGVSAMVVHPGGQQGWRNWTEYRQVRRANHEVFKRLAEKAEKTRVFVAVENIGPVEHNMFTGYPEDLLEMIQEIDCPYLGVCLDTSHANTSGPGFDIPKFIRDCGQKLFATHISDNLGQNDDHLFPYSGKIAWQPVVKAFKEINYAGLFNLEIPGERKSLPPQKILEIKAEFAFNLLNLMLFDRPVPAPV